MELFDMCTHNVLLFLGIVLLRWVILLLLMDEFETIELLFVLLFDMCLIRVFIFSFEEIIRDDEDNILQSYCYACNKELFFKRLDVKSKVLK